MSNKKNPVENTGVTLFPTLMPDNFSIRVRRYGVERNRTSYQQNIIDLAVIGLDTVEGGKTLKDTEVMK